MEEVARIVLGLEAHGVAEEVMHFLDRSGRARVVATATDERQLAEAVRQLEPDAVVASPSLAGAAGNLNGTVLLAVDTHESVQALRGALRAGARGFYLWPGDREELAGAAARVLPPSGGLSGVQARVVAVFGPRGGVGTTFLATHLAAALARRERACVLVDMDRYFGDVTAALGVPDEPSVRTVADVVPLAGELSPRHLDEILWRHPEGFRALLAPADPEPGERVRASDYRGALDVIRGGADVVVAHIPRTLDDVARAGLEAASTVLVVLSLDVLSFRAAKRALGVLPPHVVERCELVVNRAARAEITPGDVERVFGRPPLAVIAVDRGAAAAQDHGRLMPRRGRAGRAIDRLARRLVEDGS